MTWKPKSDSTMPDTSPRRRANAASEKGFTMSSRAKIPRSPPRGPDPRSSEYCLASTAKSARPLAFFRTSSARFLAWSLVRVTVPAAPRDPLYATKMWLARIRSSALGGGAWIGMSLGSGAGGAEAVGAAARWGSTSFSGGEVKDEHAAKSVSPQASATATTWAAGRLRSRGGQPAATGRRIGGTEPTTITWDTQAV